MNGAKETTMTVAKTIADQIGGKAFFMIGAKNLIDTGKGLTFKVGRGAKNAKGSVTHIEINYDEASDLYNMRALFCRGTAEPKVRNEIEGAYADMIHEFIAESTGMALSMGF